MLEMPARSPGCPTDVELESLRLHEPEGRRHAAHAGRCPACAARLAWMEEAERTFHERVFPATAGALPPARPARPRWRDALFPSLAAAAAVLVAALVPAPSTDGYVGRKGTGGAIEVWVDDPGGPRRLADGDRVHPGDSLRFVARAPGRTVSVLTVDALGQVSVLYPTGQDAPPPASGVLPRGAVLDGTLGPERVFAVFLAPGARVEDVARSARAAFGDGGAARVRAARRLPLGAEQDSLLLEKVPRTP